MCLRINYVVAVVISPSAVCLLVLEFFTTQIIFIGLFFIFSAHTNE